MNYVTIPMVVEHTGKSRSAVMRALKLAKVAKEKQPGVAGVRITLPNINRFLRLQWPTVKPMGADQPEGI